MKKQLLATLMAAAMSISLLAGCGGSASSASSAASSATSTASSATTEASTTDFTGKDPQLAKKIKILTIWAEDNDNGVLINALCQKYHDEVNPNFEWEYEMVSSDNLRQKIATLAASNDLPDLFAYESGTPLKDLIDADKVVDISKEVERTGCSAGLNDAAVALLKGLSETDDIYDLPLGLNVEGFWYNKALFAQAGCEVPTTWDEFETVLAKLQAAGIQPLTTGGSDKWPATRLINAVAVRTCGNDIMTKAANKEVKYTDAGLTAAADTVAGWAKKGYFGQGITTVDANTAGSMLMTGKAAIFYNGSWFAANLNDTSANAAGVDGIGFFNIPVKDEKVSSATSYSMNCGNVLCLDKAKYDDATAWFLKYFVENMGNLAMEKQGAVKGYNYTVQPSEMSGYTKLVLDELGKATEGFAWWEAKMSSEVSQVAQENVQSLLNGDMTGEQYMQSIQDTFDMSSK